MSVNNIKQHEEGVLDCERRPVLSIIIPIYNAENYLRQCVDSVLSQDFQDYELWLIDDGSNDSSIDIIKEYAKGDKRIKTAFIKGSGPAIPRNYGMRRAAGEYILFIDSDDYLPVNALSILVKKAMEFPDADFIRGNQRILVNDTREAQSVFAEKRSVYANTIIRGEEFMVNVLDKDYAPIDSLIKTDFLKRNNIEFHEEMIILEDGPFIIEICSKNPKCVYINEETYVYRLGNPNSVTNSKKSFAKCESLMKGAEYNAHLMHAFSDIGRQHILNRSVEHSISALFQAVMWTKRNESKKIFKAVRNLWPKMPKVGINRGHKAFIKVYNINPALAFNGLWFKRILLRAKGK